MQRPDPFFRAEELLNRIDSFPDAYHRGFPVDLFVLDQRVSPAVAFFHVVVKQQIDIPRFPFNHMDDASPKQGNLVEAETVGE
jgi:hypothetical protein